MASTPFYPNINSRSAEITQIFYGVETVVNTVLQFLKQTDNEIDACVDQTRPSLTIEIAKLKEAFIDAKKEESSSDILLKLPKIIFLTANSY